jgi:hypothetical protein
MSISPNSQQALARAETGHAPQRRSFIRRAGASLVAVGSLMVAGGEAAGQTPLRQNSCRPDTIR